MCWIDSQSKKLIHLKYLILETPYTFFSIFSWNSSFTHTERSVTYVFRYWQQQPFLVLFKWYRENVVIFLLCLFLQLWKWKYFFLKLDSHLPKKSFFICFNDSSSKLIKNVFYFILKAHFILKIFKFLSRISVPVEKTAWLER